MLAELHRDRIPPIGDYFGSQSFTIKLKEFRTFGAILIKIPSSPSETNPNNVEFDSIW
jgi:hypothetical protein